MRWLAAVALLIASASACAASFPGPFTLSDGITFYVVNPTGESFDLTVRRQDPRQNTYPRPTLVRVFDPAENLLVRHEFPGAPAAPPPWEEETFRVEGTGEGVYQVIVTGWSDGLVEVTTRPELEFGVYGHFQWLTGRGEQFADAYVFLPPGLDKLPVIADRRFDSIVLTDEAGVERLRLEGDNRRAEVDLPAEGEHVWRLSARGDAYRLDFKGYPIILCPSEQTARAVRAGVDIMPDGTICYHKHQVRAWELLQEYRRRPAQDFAVQVVPLEDYADDFLREPARNQLLFGHYGVISNLTPVLAEQNLDPDSPWFGAIRVWKDADGNPREGNPLADYHRLDLEALAALNKVLAALYWMDEPFNPYHRNPQLLNRIIIGALLDQMMIKEDERVIADNTYYFGIHAFSLCHSHSGAFSLVYGDVPPEVRQVWLAGQQRVTDRHLYGTVGGCVNQWTVLLKGLWRYCQGTQDDVRREAVLRNLRWLMSGILWNHGQRAAGYMTEASGPDATYNGITGHYMAYIYNTTGDPEILESLRRCFGLFNHTIASEPEGSWLGSSGYCHRTPGDWTSPQYGAGLGPMARHLPEAGVRMPDHVAWAYADPVHDDVSRAAAEERLRGMMRYFDDDHFDHQAANTSRASGAFDIQFANWQTYSNQWLPGVLPCEEADSFTRSFGDEFFAVKRPGYYAFLYAGVAYGLWQAPQRPKHYTGQYPHNDGLCMFWSPEFGVSLLSKNWGASRANTLLADLGDGKVEWPWYWDTASEFDLDNATVTLSGKLHETPLTYTRIYRFRDDRIESELTVTAEEAFRLEALSECIPYPLPDVKPGGLQVILLDAEGHALPNDSEARAIYFTNAGGHGHLLLLGEARSVNLGEEHSVDHYKNERDWGRALVALPTQWDAGQSATLAYVLMPCPAEEVAEALR